MRLEVTEVVEEIASDSAKLICEVRHSQLRGQDCTVLPP